MQGRDHVDRLGAARESAAYVGDSPFDIRAAKAAGMASIAVGWGGIHPRERLQAEAPVGEFVVGAETVRRLPPGTVVERLPELRVKGKAEPVEAYVLRS